MWFKNLKTGAVWQIEDESHQKRLDTHPDYQKVSDPTKPKTTTKTNTKTTNTRKKSTPAKG